MVSIGLRDNLQESPIFNGKFVVSIGLRDNFNRKAPYISWEICGFHWFKG